MSEVLIMTGSINVSNTPYVAITDSQERLLQYLSAMVSWLKLSDIKQIIFAENTNTNYDFSAIKKFAEKQGKEIEHLIFSGNKKAKRYGKSYGEGEIMEYAINHSKILKDSTNFYKITGRLFIPEFNQLSAFYQQKPNVFQLNNQADDRGSLKQSLKRYLMLPVKGTIVKPKYPHTFAQTYFYKANVGFFKKNLLHSYKRTDEWLGYRLENTYYEDLVGKDFIPLEEKFRTIGRSGSSGNVISADYSDDIIDLATTFI